MADDRELTEMQQAFVVAFTSEAGCVGKVKESAIAAGFSPKTAHEIGRQLLGKPHVKAAVLKSNFEQLAGRISTKAVHVIEEILDNKELPASIRLEAAKTALDRGGLAAVKAPQALLDDAMGKDLSEMTPDELQETVRLAGKARLMIEARISELGRTKSADTGTVLEGVAVEVDGQGNAA